MRTTLSRVVCVAAFGALSQGVRAETWSEWFRVESDVRLPKQGAGWLRPPEGLESGSALPVPILLDRERAVRDGTMLVGRGAAIEAWDVDARSLLWKLPSRSGAFGWVLHGRNVAAVFPDGPAARAGVVFGDEIVEEDGKPTPRGPSLPRAGESHEFLLRSTGGTRRVTIVAESAPEPFGEAPKIAAIAGGRVLMTRDQGLDCVALEDGRVAWSLRGKLLCESDGRVALQGEDGALLAADLEAGAVRWESPGGRFSHVTAARWTPQTLIAIRADWGRTRLEALDAEDGHLHWRCSWSRSSDLVSFRLVGGNRIFVTVADPECCRRSTGGGLPVHDGPTCLTYSLLDLATGRQIWSRQTGGRTHGGAHRNTIPTYIPFDPLAGGPAQIVGDRLLWFDVDAEALSVLDVEAAVVQLTVPLPDAKLFTGPAPDGFVAVQMEESTNWVDLATGQVSAIPVSLDNPRWARLAGERLLLPTNSNLGAGELQAYDLRRGTLAWRGPLPDGFISGSEVDGTRLLLSLRLKQREALWTGLFDVSSGARLWSLQVEAPTFWNARNSGGGYSRATLCDPYLVVSLSDGLHVYRRDDADRPR